MRPVRARNGETDRRGAGRQEQRVPSERPPVGERERPRGRVEADGFGSELEDDAVLAVELGRAEEDPLLGRASGEEILGEVGPVAGQRGIGADQRDLAAVPLPAQAFGRCVAGRAAAHDHDPARGGGAGREGNRCRKSALLAHEDLASHPLDAP